jgi:hypothetical protein
MASKAAAKVEGIGRHRGRASRDRVGTSARPRRWAWFLSGLLAVTGTNPVSAATIKVDPLGGGDYTRIQQAINSAAIGDVVVVGPGTYDEQLSIEKKITVAGIDPLVCRVVYSGIGNAVTFRSSCQTAQLMRLTVTALAGNGIKCDGTCTPVIRNNVIVGSTRAGVDGDSSIFMLANNVISGNQGVGVDGSGTRANNIVVGNGAGGMNRRNEADVITFNDVWGNEGKPYSRDHWFSSLDAPATNSAVDPVFVDEGAGDYRLQAKSPCVNAGWSSSAYSDPDGSRNDMGAYGGPEAPSPGPMVTNLEVQPLSVSQGQTITIRATGTAR